MTKKLEGLFGIKLGEYFDEKQFIIKEKEFFHGDYHMEIETPPAPNRLFMDYAVRCSKDMIIESISANSLSAFIYDAQQGYKARSNFDMAIMDWSDDLDFLRENFYVKLNCSYDWPKIIIKDD